MTVMEKVHLNEIADDINTRPKIVVCIPAYNEEKNIGSIVQRARIHADEVIVCDDGSSDDTAKYAKQEGAIVINHPKNSLLA